jgi:hypothetical protein
VGSFSEGLAAVKNTDDKWGYINKDGKLVIPCQWDNAAMCRGGKVWVFDGKNDHHLPIPDSSI